MHSVRWEDDLNISSVECETNAGSSLGPSNFSELLYVSSAD